MRVVKAAYVICIITRGDGNNKVSGLPEAINCYILIKQKLNDLRKLFQKNILQKNRRDEA